ncbi:MFS transporter [Austwickia sp. TVS 96-490-7B]|uniref:MFS transporter n=1 Tax=Austwickia sp. TVS 96-490-7B TaxID=2830843 RepID=UPI001C564449|nr:MFS transporter [Austwickia sp. TVS 96-490-7B]
MNFLEAALPHRLGGSFRALIAASSLNQFGDGMLLAAGPLLLASLTRDPFLIALAPVLQRLPILLLGLGVGAYIDRVNRQRLVIIVDLTRAAVLMCMGALVATGTMTIGLVLALISLLGVAEAFADVAGQTLLPSTVPAEHIGVAQPRMMATYVGGNQLFGPPVGAFLFAVGAAWPFVANAVCFAAGAALISRMTVRHVTEETRSSAALRHDVVEGLRWLAGNGPVRTLVLTVTLFNITYGATASVTVVWASQRLGLDEVGFGLLTSAGAVGGVVAILTFGAVTRRVSYATLMRAALVTETLVHMTCALTTTPLVAYVAMFAFGVEAFLWGTTSMTVRQALTPHHLLGRVGSVTMMGVYLGLVVGGMLGGVIARQFGITAVYWCAVAGNFPLLVVIWRQLGHLAQAGEPHRDDSDER